MEVATVNVAELEPMLPPARVKVAAELVRAGAVANWNPEGKVTVKLDPMVIVEVEV